MLKNTSTGRKRMKKKIKLHAWRNESMVMSQIFFFEDDIDMGATWIRKPEFDIEKEIEVPDEVKKPREWWLREYDNGSTIVFQHKPKNAIFLDEKFILAQEVLPGHVQVNREELWQAYHAAGMPTTERYLYEQFENMLGLPKDKT